MTTLDAHRLYTPAEVHVITGLSKSFIKDYARAKYPHARGGRKAILFSAEHIRLLLQHVAAGEPDPSTGNVSPGHGDSDAPASTPIEHPGPADWLALRSCAAERPEVSVHRLS